MRSGIFKGHAAVRRIVQCEVSKRVAKHMSKPVPIQSHRCFLPPDNQYAHSLSPGIAFLLFASVFRVDAETARVDRKEAGYEGKRNRKSEREQKVSVLKQKLV